MSFNEREHWIQYSKKLSKEAQYVERSFRQYYEDEEYQKEFRDVTKSREDYYSKMERRLNAFRTALSTLKEKLDDICHARINVETIQPMLEAFEGKLSDFKLVMRDEYGELEKEETVLTKEMQTITLRIDAWLAVGPNPTVGEDEEKQLKIEQIQRKDESERRLQLDLARQAKIGAIDKQLASFGGRYGGWDTRDHDTFIKVWTQLGCNPAINIQTEEEEEDAANEHENMHENLHENDISADDGASTDILSLGDGAEVLRRVALATRGAAAAAIGTAQLPTSQRVTLLRRLPTNVPGKTLDEFEAHLAWYLRFIWLTAQKKQLLNSWKDDKKRLEKQRERALARALSGAAGGGGVGDSRDERERDNSGVGMDYENAGDLAQELEDKAVVRERISRWKTEKEQAEASRKLRLKEEEDKTMKQRDDERRRRQQQNRVELERWKETESKSQAQLNQEAQEALKIARRASSVDPAELRRRQERDLGIAKQRVQKKEAWQHKNRSRMEVIDQLDSGIDVAANVPRDPDRLLAPTKAYEAQRVTEEHLDQAERRRLSEGAHSRNVAMSGRDLKFGGRATSNWFRPGVM